jgi:hypothetical protein
MAPARPLFRLLLAFLAAAPIASALDVFNYNATTNERFSSGTTLNPSFFMSGFDLSGVGWTTGNFGVTMISPLHFLTAAHVSFGSTISFVNTAGVLKTYNVDTGYSYVVQHASGVATDLVIGRLTAPIPGSDLITSYPTLSLNSTAAYQGLTVASFGAGQRAGSNTIDSVFLADMLPFGTGDLVADDVLLRTDYDSVTGESQGRVGDSGSPTFVNVNGTLAIVGTHSAVDESASPNLTYDVLTPYYYPEINAELTAGGYGFATFTAIPEPGGWAAIAGGLALLARHLARRKREARS